MNVHLSLVLKCPDLACVNPKAGNGTTVKEHKDTGYIESSTTDGFWKYAVSLDTQQYRNIEGSKEHRPSLTMLTEAQY